ncbi:MAG: protein kinase [Bacillota bacterium]|nr:protein kinase [Bacillota bacterium]
MEKKILDSRYRMEGMLGCGGSGSVHLCTHLKLNMPCAVKIINKDKNFFMDAKNEAFMLRDLQHEKIPKVFDILEDEETIYIVREYCEGQNLRERLNSQGPLSYEEIIKVSNQIADVLNYFHEKNPPVIYRDLKPDNIIINDSLQIKLIDFGISRIFDANKEDDTRYIGSQKYAAPEQFGLHQSTIQTDIYSFGLLLYFLYTAEDYMDVEHPDKWIKFSGSIGRKLKKSILKAISSSPKDRHKDVLSLMDDAFIRASASNGTLPLPSHPALHLGFGSKMNIAFMGLKSGVGVTHLSLMAGKTLSELGYRVLLFDLSEKGGLENIHAFHRAYDAFEKSNVPRFKYAGFEIITKNINLPLTKLLNMDYEIGIFDFGASHSRCNDFLKMQNQVMVLPSSPFAIREHGDLIQDLSTYKNVSFLVNLLNKDFQSIIDYYMIPEESTYSTGFLDFKEPSAEDRELFLNLCHIKERNPKKKGIIEKLFQSVRT